MNWIGAAALVVAAVAFLTYRMVKIASSVDGSRFVPRAGKGAPAADPGRAPAAAPLSNKWKEQLAATNVGVDFGNFEHGSHRRKAIYQDLMLPRDYGYSTWSGLEERLRRNLTQQLVDLAMVHQARGQRPQAMAAAREALSMVLAYAAPADPGVANWWQTAPKTYTVDALLKGPLEQRLRAALARGWFGSAALSYMSLLPVGPDRKGDPAEFSLEVSPKPSTAAGVRWLLAARRRTSRGDLAGGGDAARTAFKLLHRSAEELITSARDRPKNIFVAYGNHYMGGDPFVLGFPWGWLSVEFVLRRLSSYMAQAARLTPKDNSAMARAKKMKSDIDLLLAARKKTGVAGMPHWVSLRALTTVPT